MSFPKSLTTCTWLVEPPNRFSASTSARFGSQPNIPCRSNASRSGPPTSASRSSSPTHPCLKVSTKICPTSKFPFGPPVRKTSLQNTAKRSRAKSCRKSCTTGSISPSATS
uniref:(northern house mosquito) hypothetical protein n=1 Tax=Culex pipiens TaxID=7175 RepID=A0A8D8KYR3_CULPI